MQENFALYKTIFKKDVDKNDTQLFLQNVCNEYPYFSVAQFFKLQQTAENNNQLQQQLNKTALLFNNNYWLQFQLNNKATFVNDHTIGNNSTNVFNNYINDGLIKNSQPLAPKKIIIDEATIINNELLNNGRENAPTEPLPKFEENKAVIIDESQANLLNSDVEIEQTFFENNVKSVLANIEPILPTDNIEISNDSDAINKSGVNDMVAEPPLFEPLHTTDYFASVGIKIADENKANDKLGKQLKSFTAWLKTMKKVHVTEDSNMASATDINIQILADASNIEANVVTEAMANILIQQGSIKKAIEVLEKLSLLNPGKTAYFAAQINQLKES
jgi:hypothetical protein